MKWTCCNQSVSTVQQLESPDACPFYAWHARQPGKRKQHADESPAINLITHHKAKTTFFTHVLLLITINLYFMA